MTTADPPMTITNMRMVVLDSEGRLVGFQAVPPQLDSASDTHHAAPDWSRLFDLASLTPGDFHPVAPLWTPPTFADQRMAWEGPVPGWPEQTVRLEAGAYRGRIVFFQTVNPWTEPTAMREEPRSRAQRWSRGFVAIVVLIVLIVAAVVARRNLRKGRGDVRGAFRISTVVFVATLGDWLIRAKHFSNPSVQLDRVFTATGWALFSAGALWLLYLALEPYVRKFWPSTLISWSRLLAGRYRDSQVGRDVLIGVFVATAVLLVAVNFLINSAVLTLDSSRWFFPTSVTVMAIVAALALYGFYASRGGEPLLGRRLLE